MSLNLLISNSLAVRFFFDFTLTYVGAGMICSHLVNVSSLFGAVLSWGILWPLISKQKGNWYPANVPESSMTSLFGYKVCLTIYLFFRTRLRVIHCLQFYKVPTVAVFLVESFLCVALIMRWSLSLHQSHSYHC